MQSLQMRWPVPGHIGLSIITSASAPMASPRLRSRCISEIFSSSGQPASGMPSGLVVTAPFLSRCPWSRCPCRARGRARSSGSRSAPRASRSARSVSLKPSRRRSCSSGPDHRLGQRRVGPHDVHEVLEVERLGEAEDDPAVEARIVHVRGAPALQRLDLGGDGGLLRLVAAGARRLFAVEQRAAGARPGAARAHAPSMALGRRAPSTRRDPRPSPPRARRP